MSAIPPTTSNTGSIPFHIAKAYGVSPISRAAPAQQAQPAAAVSQSSGPAAKLPSAAQKLVGARVPGKVDFSGDKPTQVSGGGAQSLQMYRHPADKNAAATAVSVGRSLDVSG